MIILSSNAGFEGICRVSNAASRTRKRNSQVRAADQQIQRASDNKPRKREQSLQGPHRVVMALALPFFTIGLACDLLLPRPAVGVFSYTAGGDNLGSSASSNRRPCSQGFGTPISERVADNGPIKHAALTMAKN